MYMFDELTVTQEQAATMNVEKLAFVGDAVFELIIREKIVKKYKCRIGKLNSLKVKNVCCCSQSNFFESIRNFLTENELDIFKRGRNAHIGNVPKKISPMVYHRATGVEVLFGFWYITGQIDRIRWISSKFDL